MTSRADKQRAPFTLEIRTSKLARKRNRFRQPSDPAEAARRQAEIKRNPELWGLNEEALRLASNANVADEAETRTKVRRVQRFDVFHVFHARGDLELSALTAVRRLHEDYAILHRTSGTSGHSVATKNSSTSAALAHARILAGQRISDAKDKTGAHSWSILEALIERPAIMGSEINNWRSTVQHVTGEINHMAQAALVKAAAMNLAGAYSAIDGSERRRA